MFFNFSVNKNGGFVQILLCKYFNFFLFLIIHGEKDHLVSSKQSKLLSAWLNISGVPNELIIVKDAPHFGVMFDVDEVRNKVMAFLKKQLN